MSPRHRIYRASVQILAFALVHVAFFAAFRWFLGAVDRASWDEGFLTGCYVMLLGAALDDLRKDLRATWREGR